MWRSFASLLIAGAALAACGSSDVSNSLLSSGPSHTNIGILHSISCPTASLCVAQGASDILVSHDAGASWSINDTVSGLATMSVMDCASPLVCVALGTDPTASSDILVQTFDGGTHWTTNEISKVPALFSGLSCPSPTECVAVGEAMGGSAATVLRFDPAQRGPVVSGTPSDLGGTSFTPVAIWCDSDQTCLALGTTPPSSVDDFSVSTTTTGGRLWKTRWIPTVGLSDLSGLFCQSARECFATGFVGTDGFIDLSTDQGVHWHAGAIPSDVGDVTGLACSSSTTCVAVGSTDEGASTMLSTSDGGRRWDSAWVDPTFNRQRGESLTAVECQVRGACVSVGYDSAAVSAAEMVRALTAGSTATPVRLPNCPTRPASLLAKCETLPVSAN